MGECDMWGKWVSERENLTCARAAVSAATEAVSTEAAAAALTDSAGAAATPCGAELPTGGAPASVRVRGAA